MNDSDRKNLKYAGGVIALIIILSVSIILINYVNSSAPPEGTFVTESSLADTGHVFVGVILNSATGLYVVEEGSFWEGAYWLNKNDFELVDVISVTSPDRFPGGNSVVLDFIFVRYNSGSRADTAETSHKETIGTVMTNNYIEM